MPAVGTARPVRLTAFLYRCVRSAVTFTSIFQGTCDPDGFGSLSYSRAYTAGSRLTCPSSLCGFFLFVLSCKALHCNTLKAAFGRRSESIDTQDLCAIVLQGLRELLVQLWACIGLRWRNLNFISNPGILLIFRYVFADFSDCARLSFCHIWLTCCVLARYSAFLH